MIVLFLSKIRDYYKFITIYKEYGKMNGARLNTEKTVIIPLSEESFLQCNSKPLKTSEGNKVLDIYLGSREFELKNWGVLATTLDNLI